LFQVQTSRQHPINLIVYISFFFFYLSSPLFSQIVILVLLEFFCGLLCWVRILLVF
jgi:hypothetical protein